jgi:nicotinamidase-related amidase
VLDAVLRSDGAGGVFNVLHALLSEDTGLVVIDFQEKLVRAMPNREQATKNANILVAAASQFDMPIFVTEQYPQGLGPTIGAIRPHMKNEVVIEKNTFSAYTSEFSDAVAGSKRRTFLVFGIEAHVCVLQTVRDLLAQGYEVQVVHDALCSRSKHNFKVGVRTMADMGAYITTTEIAVFDLLKESGTPAFKFLSPLIK